MSGHPFQAFADSPAYRDAAAIVDALAAAGHMAYFAGGCVRDALLGREPKDYDVATSATPDAVRACFRRAQGVGESFGVMLVPQPSSHVEVATFRRDGDYLDGRRPDHVTFAGEIEDARRRDFTINGMFYDPHADRLIDHVGGRHDLAARLVRAIGDPEARFAEDYLRILRAVRFAARLSFAIEPTTQAAIRRQASKLTRVAPERIADELRRMLMTTALSAIERLDHLGASDVLFRRVDARFGSVTRVADSSMLVRQMKTPIPFPLALAAIVAARLLTVGVEVRRVTSAAGARDVDGALRETLRYSNDDSAAVRVSLTLDALLDPAVPPSVATVKRFLAKPHAADALRMLRALAEPANASDRVAWLDAMIVRFAARDIAPLPLITGDDLTAMGFSPSPAFKRTLDAAYDAQLEGELTSLEAARAFARRRIAAL